VKELFEQLDDPARTALDLAIGAAAALGDRECGTAYLLYGIFATAQGEMAELADLFALDGLRVERAIHKVREPYLGGSDYDGDPMLSLRCRHAARTLRQDGTGPTGVFELLYGALEDNQSDAAAVLRELGVRPEEVRRLAAYGRRHLSRDEAAMLLEVLDRRRAARHLPWWGPAAGDDLISGRYDGAASLPVARSRSARAWLDDLGATHDGMVVTLRVESLAAWVLPPHLEPPEILVPGGFSRRRVGPEILRFELVFADGSRASNLDPAPRWSSMRPASPVLVPLETASRTRRGNDRRSHEQREVAITWWVWPRPVPGTIEVRLDWPAEVLSGLASFDARPLLDPARHHEENVDERLLG
jgi:hypothetical protein